MTRINPNKYDLDSFNIEDVRAWKKELLEAFDDSNKCIQRLLNRKRLLDKYKELHDKWMSKFIKISGALTGVCVFLLALAIMNTTTPGAERAVLLAGLEGITVIMYLYLLNEVKEYIPHHIRIGSKEKNTYYRERLENTGIMSLILALTKQENMLFVVDKYKNAYSTLCKISKEQNLDIDSLYAKYNGTSEDQPEC